jgi:CO dehydrogenase nickel-insertion accessory protein CooC1
MKQIVVISGKGGTGKTVITGAFAFLAEDKVMTDCDVDAADLHLLLDPEIKECHEFRRVEEPLLIRPYASGAENAELFAVLMLFAMILQSIRLPVKAVLFAVIFVPNAL